MRILIVEDEPGLSQALEELFVKERFSVDAANTWDEALDAAMTNAYDCLIVDVMLPDGDGIQLVKELREQHIFTPILVLTVRNDTKDRVKGLHAGADDYLGKPFDSAELVARVHALIRRSGGQPDLDTMTQGSASLHRKSRTLEVHSDYLELSSKEFMLMEYFFRNPGQVLTRDQLLSHLWGPDTEVADSALDTYIYFLRKKCARVGLKSAIKTVRGEGYVFTPESDGPDKARNDR